MTARNVLVVALGEVPDEKVRRAIETRDAVADVNVLVLAPRRVWGRFGGWRAMKTRRGSKPRSWPTEPTEVGESDPLLAVEDALRSFPADEIVLAGPVSGETEAELSRFHLPISRLDGADEAASEEAGGAEAVAREVTRGRGSYTPVALLAVVIGVVTAAIVVISLITYLVVWLV